MTEREVAEAGWTILVHGGAGNMRRGEMPAERDAEARAVLAQALGAGGAVLAAGGSAVAAVEAAVRVLEDDPLFNAGRGAVFTSHGSVELDAAIMDGAERKAGSVAGISRTRNPVTLARAVMERSHHVMLIGEGAEDFARAEGVEEADPAWFRTEEREAQFEAHRGSEGEPVVFDAERKFGTVGAVARDAAGHVAAATSTGGITGKHPGRVGDSPVIGAGTWADDRAGAVSATGSGEYYIRAGVGHAICARMRLLGEDAQAAADAVQAETLELGGEGGVIVLDAAGGAAFSFNTPGMYRGRLAAGGEAEVAIYGDE